MVSLVRIQEIYCGENSLPNSVSIFGDGKLVVADGGNDAVLIFDDQGKIINKISGTGYGKYNFKEPVAAAVDRGGQIYIADWHNHRVVAFDNKLNYIGEFGFPSLTPYGSTGPTLKRLAGVLYSLFQSGIYIPKHFDGTEQTKKKKLLPPISSAKSLVYFISRTIRLIAYDKERWRDHSFDKPNGIAFLNNEIWLTQKNKRCINVHENTPPHKLLRKINYPNDREKFGRLGNISISHSGEIFVCDEQSGAIWYYIDKHASPKKITGADSGLGTFMPFSCVKIAENYIAVCGCKNIQIINYKKQRVEFSSQNMGELHGVAFDEKRNALYTANRSRGVIQVFDVTGMERG